MCYCADNPNQDDATCCLHDLPKNHRYYPGRICCWCGDLFQTYFDSNKHGEYEPEYTGPKRVAGQFNPGDCVYWMPEDGEPRGPLMPNAAYFVAMTSNDGRFGLTSVPCGPILGWGNANEMMPLPPPAKEKK